MANVLTVEAYSRGGVHLKIDSEGQRAMSVVEGDPLGLIGKIAEAAGFQVAETPVEGLDVVLVLQPKAAE